MTDREQALRDILNELATLFPEEMRAVLHEKLTLLIAQMGNVPPAEVKRKRGWPKGKKRGNPDMVELAPDPVEDSDIPEADNE